MKQERKWQKRSGLVSETVDGECLTLDPEKNKFFRLNRVGGHILELCNNTVAEEIAEAISQKFEINATEALLDVQEYLEKLNKADLVVENKT